MELIITGKNLTVSEKVETYVRRKIGKLERHLPDAAEARVELSNENTRNANQRQIVQVTILKNGTIIRAEERAADMLVAVDAVVDKLDKQIRRYKDKRMRKRRAASHSTDADSMNLEDAENAIVRVKRFRTPPMTEEAAIEQMELLGHSFFIFSNETTGTLNVLYRRQDGKFGLLEPVVG